MYPEIGVIMHNEGKVHSNGTLVLFHSPFLLNSCSSPLVFTPELSDNVLFLLLILGGSWSPREAPTVGVNQHLVAHASV